MHIRKFFDLKQSKLRKSFLAKSVSYINTHQIQVNLGMLKLTNMISKEENKLIQSCESIKQNLI